MANIHVAAGSRTPAHLAATILGVAFLLVGAVGFVSPGFMGTHLSMTHNMIHLVSGIVSLYFGRGGTSAGARAFCLAFGVVYGLLGIAGFAAGTPGTPSMAGMPADDRLLRVIPGALELGTNDHVLHVVLAAAYILAALMTHTHTDEIARHEPHRAPSRA